MGSSLGLINHIFLIGLYTFIPRIKMLMTGWGWFLALFYPHYQKIFYDPPSWIGGSHCSILMHMGTDDQCNSLWCHIVISQRFNNPWLTFLWLQKKKTCPDYQSGFNNQWICSLFLRALERHGSYDKGTYQILNHPHPLASSHWLAKGNAEYNHRKRPPYQKRPAT